MDGAVCSTVCVAVIVFTFRLEEAANVLARLASPLLTSVCNVPARPSPNLVRAECGPSDVE